MVIVLESPHSCLWSRATCAVPLVTDPTPPLLIHAVRYKSTVSVDAH